MKRVVLTLSVIALIILHQDFWNWRTARPFIFGFLPIGLFYHVCFTVAVSLLMWTLVKLVWPYYLEEEVEHSLTDQAADLQRDTQEGREI